MRVSTAIAVAKHMCRAAKTLDCGFGAISPISAACLVSPTILRHLKIRTAADEFLMTDPAGGGTCVFRMNAQCDLFRMRTSREFALAVVITTFSVAAGTFISASSKTSPELVALLHMVHWSADDEQAEFVGPVSLKERRQGLFATLVLDLSGKMPLYECVGKTSICVDDLEVVCSGPDISQFRLAALDLMDCETEVSRLLECSFPHPINTSGEVLFQRKCSSCNVLDTRAVPHKCCGKCVAFPEAMRAFYCGRACQQKMWAMHRKVHKKELK
jgi:hypothetical protein